MTSPLRTVLAAFESGARTRTEVVRHTGLRADLVDAATEHLIRLGRVRAEPLSAFGRASIDSTHARHSPRQPSDEQCACDIFDE